MARKHPQPLAVNRSRLVGVVDDSVRKLIIFMLLHSVLSPFVLITADTLNEGRNNNQAAQMPLLNSGKQQFATASHVNANVNNVKTNCTIDDSLMSLSTESQSTKTNLAAEGKNANGNSISQQSEIIANGERPYDDNLSMTGNASIRNQSQTITASDSMRAKRDDANFNTDGERVLSRKRRYLIFPPGSSIQIVYDTYHPIVGYSNYLILGITAAMAWELPSSPVYYDEQLRDSYDMDESPQFHRNDKNVTNIQYVLPSKNVNNVNRIKSNFYYTNIPKQKFAYDKSQYQSPSKSYYQSVNRPVQSTSNKFQHYVSYADNLMKQFKLLTEKIPQNRPLSTKDFQEFANIISKNVKANRKANSKYAQKINYAHLVHPAFKKRSIDELTPLDRFDLKLHRNSRHALYKQINTFLKTQGNDGNECILKMLCETGQRKHNEQPGSMVVELLRTIFTLPEPIEPTGHPEHKKYDEAHASIEDCQKLYPNCKASVWNSKYM